MEEKKLVALAKKGDHQAFALLFRENYAFLVKYLIKISMNPDIAEDLAQETMAKSIEKIHLYTGKSKFSSWLISIGTNLFIDQYRRRKRESDWQKAEQSVRKLQWQMESRNEEWNDAMNALGKLQEGVRIPIVLKHYYGYSYEEIGDIIGISPGTVKSRIHNGILSIRKELKLDDNS